MSETSQGPGWWLASDGKWYPPEAASKTADLVSTSDSLAVAEPSTDTVPPQVQVLWRVEPAPPVRPPWGLAELGAVALLASLSLVILASVAGALYLLRVGLPSGPIFNSQILQLASTWVVLPYGIIPLAALGLTWWRIDKSAAADPGATIVDVLRSRRILSWSICLLVVTVGGVVARVASVLVGQDLGRFDQATRVAFLGDAAGSFVLACFGLYAAFKLRRRCPA